VYDCHTNSIEKEEKPEGSLGKTVRFMQTTTGTGTETTLKKQQFFLRKITRREAKAKTVRFLQTTGNTKNQASCEKIKNKNKTTGENISVP
jgi:hypothetical protein